MKSSAEKAAVAAALAAVAAGAFFFYAVASFKTGYPYGLNLGEGSLSQASRLFAEGKNPYHDLREPPFTLLPYGPVYVALAAWLRAAIPGPFAAGRALTLFSATACAAVIFLWLRRRAGAAAAAACALLFIGTPYVRSWGTVVNVDMTGLLFSLVSFYFFSRAAEEGPAARACAAAGMAASLLAFYTKSSMVAAPAAYFLLLVARRRFRRAAVFFAVEGAAVLLVYGALNLWTHGGYFFHTTLEISRRRFFPEFVLMSWKDLLAVSPLLPAAAAAGLWLARKGEAAKAYAAVYLALATLLTVSLGKQGSDSNYFLDWTAVSVLMAGLVLAEARRRGGARVVVTWLLVAAQASAWALPAADLAGQRRMYRESAAFFDRISLFVKKTEGKIISQDPSLLPANGKEIYYDPFPMGQMTYSGVWDPSPVLEEIEAGKIPLVLLNFYAPVLKADRNFPPQFMAVFKRRYRMIGRAVPPPGIAGVTRNTLFLYVPKND